VNDYKDKMLETLEKYYEEGLLYKQVHPTLPLTIWNYSEKVQYEGLWDEITLMCRGLVTDKDGNVVARPFKKFFNLEEGKHTPTSDFDVYMKLDGSLGILFNYESPKRGETFVTRKITRAASKIVLGLENCMYLGNMDAKRDWGHAKDYIEGMYLILQHDEPDDFVLATGITTTIREFVRLSFLALQIEIDFRGEGLNEEGFITKNNSSFKVSEGQVVVKVDPKYFRPTEVDLLIGDASKAFEKLNWSPKYDLALLIQEMIESDVELFKKELLIKENGFGGIR
jgi:hypothetical protein